jgi:hypothetical protein
MTQPKKTKVIVPPPAQEPAGYTLADIAAMQALEKGEASPDQQKRALAWIINNVCLTYDLEYRTEDRDHAFASGRRFAGLQVVKALKLNTTLLAKTGA